MHFNEIKFQFDISSTDSEIDKAFKKIGSLLNIRFDDNLNEYSTEDNSPYTLLNISDFNKESIENEIRTFFTFSFKEIINVPLYRFLVLKNKDKYTILANINSYIFDHNSIKSLYNIFIKKNDEILEKNILNYHNKLESYLSSPDFEKDSSFWKNCLLENGDNVKFYQIKSENYANFEIQFNNEKLADFTKEHNVSKMDFFTGILSLYLSRIDRTKDGILKTNIHNKNIDTLDKNTLINVNYLNESTFIDYLNEIKNSYKQSCEHTKIDIENYLEDEVSYYSIHDFENFNYDSKIKENFYIYNCFGNALTLNVYENHLNFIYNADLFSAEYMKHMGDNLDSLIERLLDSPNHLLKDVNILCESEESLLSDYTKGEYAEVEQGYVFSKGSRKHVKENPDALAVDDGINQITYGELEKSSNSIANDLSLNHGITRGSHVALILPRTYHFAEMVLAINKLGAAFVPIDLIYPKKRMQHMIDISESECIITTKDLSQQYDFGLDVICIEDLDRNSDVEVEIMAKGEDLFSIMFTSGTTGLPKGDNHRRGFRW